MIRGGIPVTITWYSSKEKKLSRKESRLPLLVIVEGNVLSGCYFGFNKTFIPYGLPPIPFSSVSFWALQPDIPEEK
jgi:hypothetical protein